MQAWLSDPDTNLGLALAFPDLGSAPPPVLAANPELVTGELWHFGVIHSARRRPLLEPSPF